MVDEKYFQKRNAEISTRIVVVKFKIKGKRCETSEYESVQYTNSKRGKK